MPHAKLSTDFAQFADAARKTLLDQKRAETGQFYYNLDFNIVYPFLWQQTAMETSTYEQYDQVALNIIALLLSPPQGCYFRPLFTTPSVLELLDSVSHRLMRAKQAARTDEVYTRILQTVDSWGRDDWRRIALGDTPYWGILNEIQFHLNINDAEHLADCLSRLFGDNGPLSHHIEEEALAAIGREGQLFREACNRLFDIMKNRRLGGDRREYKDRLLHYKIDCANIALSTFIERVNPYAHAEFVCSAKVRAYNPAGHGRSPLVPLLALSASSRFQDKTNIDLQTRAYLHSLERHCSDCLSILQSEPDVRNLPEIDIETLKVTQLRFIRPLLAPLSVPYSRAGEEIEVTVMTMLRSPDEFREKSRAAEKLF